jgi:hypothetical protein
MVYGNHKYGCQKRWRQEPRRKLVLRRSLKMDRSFNDLADKGIMFNHVTAASVTQEDPWFLAFKPNSLKGNITLLKKEFAQQENIEALCKLSLMIVFI